MSMDQYQKIEKAQHVQHQEVAAGLRYVESFSMLASSSMLGVDSSICLVRQAIKSKVKRSSSNTKKPKPQSLNPQFPEGRSPGPSASRQPHNIPPKPI